MSDEQRIVSFAKRLNVVLRAVGWPECEYVGSPKFDPYTTGTMFVDGVSGSFHVERYGLQLTRSDQPQTVRVGVDVSDKDKLASVPTCRILNELVRCVRRALA